MVYGYVDVQSRQEASNAMAALLAITEHAAAKCAPGVLTPMDVQLISLPYPSSYLRVRFLVDEADSEGIFKTGWLRLYTSRARKTPVFFTLPWPKPPQSGTIEAVIHAAEFLNTLIWELGWNSLWGGAPWKGCWRYVEGWMRERVASGNWLECMRPLKEHEREALFREAERMRAQLDPPASPPDEFPPLGTAPEPAPALCWVNSPLRINQDDQENLWRVAYLGAGERFRSPEAVWLCGPSPIDLRKQVALRQPPLVTSSCAQNL